MMKKKNYLHLLAFAMVAMLSVCFVSCGDDDDEGGGSTGITAKELVGQWREISSSSHETIWTFNSDGTWETSVYYNAIYTNWEISGGKLIMTRTNGRQETYTAYIKDGLLYLYFGDVKVRDGEVVDASEASVWERVQ